MADPTVLRYGYVRRFADATGPTLAAADEPAVLHVGGGGFTFPRYLAAADPNLTQTVLELDPVVLEVARARLGFMPTPADGRRASATRGRSIERLPDAAYDVVAADAFGGLAVPWHLTTREFVAELGRVLRPGGIVVANLIDYPPLGFVRAETATLARALRARRGHRRDADDRGWRRRQRRARRVRFAARHRGDRGGASRRWGETEPTAIVHGPDAAVDAFIGEAPVLPDDFAPVDQLLGR